MREFFTQEPEENEWLRMAREYREHPTEELRRRMNKLANGVYRTKPEPQQDESLKIATRIESEEEQMGELFTLTARRCKQCGRILVSEESVERGYGCQCAKKAKQEELEKQPVPGQIELFDYLKQQTESEG